MHCYRPSKYGMSQGQCGLYPLGRFVVTVRAPDPMVRSPAKFDYGQNDPFGTRSGQPTLSMSAETWSIYMVHLPKPYPVDLVIKPLLYNEYQKLRPLP